MAGAVAAVLPLAPPLADALRGRRPGDGGSGATAGGAGRGRAAAAAGRHGANQPGRGRLAAIGVAGGTLEQAVRLGRLAISAGADGLVCSPHEVAALRAELGDWVKLVVPGIRPAGSEPRDQARIMTPEQAVAAGADWIVVGRPITAAPDPAAAAISRALA